MLRRFFTQLNLFNTYSTDPAKIHFEIITTRIYLVLIFVTYSILILYSAQREFQQTIQVSHPSMEDYQYLARRYPDTLSCPCSQLAIPYKSFLTLQPVIHPACASDFVSDPWFAYVYREIPSMYDPIDFRAVSYAHFHLLRHLCQSSKQAVDSALIYQFSTETLISSHGVVLTSESVHTQANVFIQDFIASIASQQQRLYRLTLTSIEGNYLWSALGTNAVAQYSRDGQIIVYNRQYDIWTDTLTTNGRCRCEADYTCNTKLFALENNEQDIVENPLRIAIQQRRTLPITGFRSGCMPLRSLLQSNFECYGNESCLNRLISSIQRSNVNFNVHTINATNASSMKIMMDQWASNLMIENWMTNIDYASYFQTCHPLICSYSYTERFNLLYIITTIVGLLGGLTIVLRSLAPLLTRIYFKVEKPIPVEISVLENGRSYQQRLHQMYGRTRNFLIQFNLYKRRNNTRYTVRQQILATRLFIILLITITFSLVLITGFDRRAKTIQLSMPSKNDFENLFDLNPMALSCPCSKIAIPYAKFLSLVPTLHQICSSDFLSDDWMDRLVFSTSLELSSYYRLDIRSYGLTMFRTLHNLCTVANLTLTDALKNFQNTQLISTQALSREQFEKQAQTLINEFQSDLPVTFSQTLQNTREIIRGNQLLTTTVSNFFMQPIFDDFGRPSNLQSQIGITLALNETSLSCSCLRDTCTQPLGFYNVTDTTAEPVLLFSIPGMRSACYPLDALRLSTLECWFDETCITLVRTHLSPISVEQMIPALDRTQQRRFTPFTLLGDIIDQLMIEEWTNVSDYTAYYSSCQPSTCSYIVLRRLDFIYIITTIIGIFGGLSIVLRKICPLIVRHGHRWRRPMCRNLVVPSAANNNFSKLTRLKNILHRINLFDSDSPYANIQARERLTTRIYLVSLIFILAQLFIYLSSIEHSRTMTVVRPSLSTVIQLQGNRELSLSCPCSQPSTIHSTFLTIKVDKYHALCSNYLITPAYRDTLMSNNLSIIPSSKLFVRQFLAAQLTLLSNLCVMTRQVIDTSLSILRRKSLITLQIMTVHEFEETINATIDRFYAETSSGFRNKFHYMQSSIEKNALMSSFLSNWRFQLDPSSTASQYLMLPISYDNCSCGIFSNCVESITIDEQSYPGLHVGCLPLSALLQSTLQCFYNETCLVQLHEALFEDETTMIPLPLLPSTSRFSSNATIQTLVDELFVESWSHEKDFNAYFRSCSPSICTYIQIRRFDFFYIVTTMISLIGGLATVFRRILPVLIAGYYSMIGFIHRRQLARSSSLPIHPSMTEVARVNHDHQFPRRKKLISIGFFVAIVLCALPTVYIAISIGKRPRDPSQPIDGQFHNICQSLCTSTLESSTNIDSSVLCSANATWNPKATTVAGQIDGLYNPYDVLVGSADNLYILDAGNNRIIDWSMNSKQGRIVAGDGALNSASGMVSGASFMILGNESLYLIDRYGTRIQSFSFSISIQSPNATTILDTTTYNTGLQLTRMVIILNIAFDQNKNLFYMSTIFDDRLFLWNISDGQMDFLEAKTLVSNSDMTMIRPYLITVDSVSNAFFVLDSRKRSLYQFALGTNMGFEIHISYPNDIGFYFNDMQLDFSGGLYLTDYVNHRIAQVMIDTGGFRTVAGIGLNGLSPTRLSFPNSFKFDTHHNMYVVDTGNNRIQRFNLIYNGCSSSQD